MKAKIDNDGECRRSRWSRSRAYAQDPDAVRFSTEGLEAARLWVVNRFSNPATTRDVG